MLKGSNSGIPLDFDTIPEGLEAKEVPFFMWNLADAEYLDRAWADTDRVEME